MSIIQDYMWLHRGGGGSGKPEESKTVPLDMADGDMEVLPSEGKTLSSVTITKPDTLIAENIKKGVEIGGTIGAYEAQPILQTKTATENGTYTPQSGYDGFSQFTVALPAWDGTSSVGYSISATATNCTIDGSTTYEGAIKQGGTVTLTLAADGTNYKLPQAITVTGATGTYTRTSDTAGTLVLSAATGDVSFNVVGEQNGYTVTVSIIGDCPEDFIGEYTGLHIYDGTNTSGTYLGRLESTTQEIIITSGHIYLYGAGEHSDDRLDGATGTGGVINAFTTDRSTHSGLYAKADVTGSGTLTINTYLH